MRSQKPNAQHLIIFMHIPKTAGLTLRDIIKKQYGQGESYEYFLGWNLDRLSELKNQKIKCLYGHFLFGVHFCFSRPFIYTTILRDPIDRVVSTYFYILNSGPENPYYEKIKQMSFEDFIRSDDEALKIQTMNLQTRYVSGVMNHEPPNLQKAKENIIKYFSVVGIMELFDESVFLMKREFGWHKINYVKRNVTQNRPRKEQFSKDVIELIAINNELDIQLYEFARTLLDKRLKELDPRSRQELTMYLNRQKNTKS